MGVSQECLTQAGRVVLMMEIGLFVIVIILVIFYMLATTKEEREAVDKVVNREGIWIHILKILRNYIINYIILMGIFYLFQYTYALVLHLMAKC
jgi:small-conductance mechanosensitive channel